MNIPTVRDVLINTLVAGLLSLSSAAAVAQYAGPAISSASPTATAPVSALNPDYGDVAIMPGDIISIVTPGVPEFTTSSFTAVDSLTPGGGGGSASGLRVGSLGEVTLPYIGTVTISGLTPSGAATFLNAKLKDGGFLVDPQVSVALIASPTRVITVIGEVQKPAPVPAFGRVRLLDAIAACGGFTPLASHTITLRRLGNPDPITIELGVNPETTDVTNLPLMAGDTVIVPKVGNIFIVGEFKNPAAFPLSTNTPITVMRAVSMAGGLKYSAALSKARIMRRMTDTQIVQIDFDLSKVMHGQARDVALKSDDVLFVPANGFKAVISSGGAAVAASALYGIAYIAK